MTITILHNPKCTKSRLTLGLLEERKLDIQIIEYLKNPPTSDEFSEILKKLGKTPEGVIRKKEAEEEGIYGLSGEELIKAMVAHPRSIERPIVINGNQARIGRPPEDVLEII